jgi:hypothetical protein
MAPWNGSGDFSLSDTIAPATNADANELQAILTDIGTGIDASINADGQSTITGALKGADGTAALPAYSFSADLNSGFYRIGSDNLGLSLGGTKRIDFGTAGTVIAGTFDATSYVSPKVVLSSDAGATVGPTIDLYRDSASPAVSDFIGSVDFNGRDSGASKQLYAQVAAQITDPTAASEDAIIILRAVIAGAITDVLKSSATGLTGFGALAISGALSGLTTLSMNGAISGLTAPTRTIKTTGSGTYTIPAGCQRVRVRMSGGGGGGGAKITNSGSQGGTTSFESWTCIGGLGGTAGDNATRIGGAGGTGGATGTGTLVYRCDGGGGASGGASGTAGVGPAAGNGGSNPFGGAGIGSGNNSSTAGGAGSANTGAGGGGANGGTGASSACGGGAGEYLEFWMTAAQIGAGVSYAVGAAGAKGPVGTTAGGDGAAGVIIIEEFYW